MAVDLSKVNFTTGENYMKRSSLGGHAPIVLGGYGVGVAHTVDLTPLRLTKPPHVEVWVEFDQADTLWAGGEFIDVFTDQSILTGSLSDTAYPQLTIGVTATTLKIRLTNNTSPVATGSREVYWLIYLDYDDAS